MIILEKPVVRDNLIAETLGERIGVEMRTTQDLMNWIIFGDPKKRSFFGDGSKDF